MSLKLHLFPRNELDKYFLLYDCRESRHLIGSICPNQCLCHPENRSKLAYKLTMHEKQLKLVYRS